MKPSNSYIICSSPRTGSSLLCAGLSKTGIAGNPDEYFTPVLRPIWVKQWGGTCSDCEFVDKAIECSTTANGVCGLKLFNSPEDHLAYLKDLLCDWKRCPHDARSSITVSDLLEECFPNVRYIWLTRRHKIRQAISYWRALRTNIWFVWDADEAQKAETNGLVYSYSEIDRLLGSIILQEALWADFFTTAKIKPLTIVYEDIVEDYEGTLRNVFEYIEVPAPDQAPFLLPDLKKQAGEESDLWVNRFYRDRTKELWAPS